MTLSEFLTSKKPLIIMNLSEEQIIKVLMVTKGLVYQSAQEIIKDRFKGKEVHFTNGGELIDYLQLISCLMLFKVEKYEANEIDFDK